jgi:hypothetical protein
MAHETLGDRGVSNTARALAALSQLGAGSRG